jgi:hypothetical protein
MLASREELMAATKPGVTEPQPNEKRTDLNR